MKPCRVACEMLDNSKRSVSATYTQNAGAAAEVVVGVSVTGSEYVPQVPWVKFPEGHVEFCKTTTVPSSGFM